MTESMQKKLRSVLIPVIAAVLLLLLGLSAADLLLSRRRGEKESPATIPPAAMAPSAHSPRTSAVFDPDREVRGLWIPSVQNITFPSKPGLSADELRAELEALVNMARDANLNTLCLQVRPASDALYASALFPASAYLSGTQGEAPDGSFDPLAYLCALAAAEDEPMAVYAWVNPLRVTAAGEKTDALSPDNPAVLHPDWTVSYNGALYYNAALPEVRQLIADGVKEICDSYPVAGVIFDDYFYPYPVSASDGSVLVFHDEAQYKSLGAGFDTIGDFRRDNVNRMVRACYDAVKSVSPYMQFGIAPFGIWQNDDGKNGGSDTAGLSAYSAIYCDALAWMEGGYLDFIAPQLYWTFATKAARYDTLVRWWNAQCDRTDTKLWISHAIYNYAAWDTKGEMGSQIAFARSELSYRGSLFYGYPQLAENTLGVADEIRSAMADDIIYYSTEPTGDACSPIVITTPQDRSRCDDDGIFLLGQSDPDMPLTLGGVPVSRTRNGYFSLYVTLSKGKNEFLFEQAGKVTPFTLWKGQYAPDDPGKTDVPEPADPSAAQTDGALLPVLTAPSPALLTAVPWADGLPVSVTADKGCTVTAVLGNTVITLKAGKTADGRTVYSGTLPLEKTEKGTWKGLGTLTFQARRGDTLVTCEGGEIWALGDLAKIPVEVIKNDAELKTARNSWYYDDYAPQMQGMRVWADCIRDGFAELSFVRTAYISASDLKVCEDPLPVIASVGMPVLVGGEREFLLTVPSDSPVPTNCIKDGNVFSITFYHAQFTSGLSMGLPDNPLFSSVYLENKDNRCTVVFTLKARDNFYGFDVSYEDGTILVHLRAPGSLDRSSDTPLAGKVIVLDAGHGGSDSGALTPGTAISLSEKDCNLAIVLAAEKKLRALGAEVVLLREEDVTVDIYDRMDRINELCPDLVLSIHQNSMPSSTDITHIRGIVGLYWTESGRSLAECVSSSVAAALGRYQRETASQRLAMLRNYKFPSALIEIGFVTCPEEFETLTAPGGIERTADAICRGILDWYETQEAVF